MAYRKKMGVLVLCFFAGILVIMGCSSSDDDPVAQLSTYAEDVQACTPYLGESFIDEWTGWDPTTEFAVLQKLFNPESGWEGIFYAVEEIDTYIEILNQVSDLWDTDGEYERIVGEFTPIITVDSTDRTVTVPFFNEEVSVDRVIDIVSEGEDGTVTIKLAFAKSSDEEALVARYELPDFGEVGVYYGRRNNTTGIMDLWFAGVSEPEGEDEFHGAFKWRGNPDEGWFALAQSTDAGMNVDDRWEILAGGEVDDEMAFRADIKSGVEEGDYYIVTTLENIESAEPAEVAPNLSAGMLDDEGALAYITIDNDLCLGFLNDYPTLSAELDWVE